MIDFQARFSSELKFRGASRGAPFLSRPLLSSRSGVFRQAAISNSFAVNSLASRTLFSVRY